MINSINSITHPRKNNVTFEGLKENLRLGESVLREFKNEYPSLKSSTSLRLRCFNIRIINPQEQANLMSKLDQIIHSYVGGIRKFRDFMELFKSYLRSPYNLPEYMRILQAKMSSEKFANCGEIADVMQFKLVQRGEKAHNVNMKITEDITRRQKRGFGDHTFTVIGLAPKAKINKPRTWGQNAVVVDGWGNIVMPAKNALEYFKQILGFNPKDSYITFANGDLIAPGDLDKIAIQNAARNRVN